MPLTIKTNNTSVDDVFATYKAEIRLTMIEEDVTSRHVDRTTLPKNSGTSWNEAKITQPDAAAWNEGEPHPEATMTSTNLQITPAMSGLKLVITRRHMEMAQEDLGAKIAQVIGKALANYKDDQLVTDFDSGAISIPGAGNALSMGVIRAGLSRIRNGNGSGEPYTGSDFHCVLHPYALHDILESIGNYTSGNPQNTEPGMPQDLLKKYAIYNILGVQFEQDSNITVDGSDDAKSGLFAREAIRLVDFNMPDTDKEFDKDTKTWAFFGDQDFGHGVYNTSWLVELYSDVLAPTV